MWQNAGKCGVDQWNFVPSPISASQDPTGRYTKKWVPELRKLPLELLHRPWETPQVILEKYGVFLGDNYPHRIVTDLDRERARAVENVVNMRRKAPYFNDEQGCDYCLHNSRI
jgi:deoxyribodipyrimidine photo-lyase